MNKILTFYIITAMIVSSGITQLWLVEENRKLFISFIVETWRFVNDGIFPFVYNAFPLASQWPLEKKVKAHENYATNHGGAKILETSPFTYYAKAILDDNPDTYMLISSSAETKYFTIALTEDILFEGLALVNKELFSSNIYEFEVFGSQSFPEADWIYLGDFRFENSRQWQIFKANPAWIRYIRITIRSHYEEDKYISLTQVRVFGKTMLSEFKNDLNTDHTMPQFNLSFPRDDVRDAVKMSKGPINRTSTELKIYEDKQDFNLNMLKLSGNCTSWCEIEYILSGEPCETIPIHNYTMNATNITFSGPSEKPTRSNNSESYESVFKKLAKHIKILEENQKLLQKFMEAQDNLNDYLKIDLKSLANELEELKSLNSNLGNSLFYQIQEINKLRVNFAKLEDSIFNIKKDNIILNYAYKFSFIFIIVSLLIIIFVNKSRKKANRQNIKKLMNSSFTSEKSINISNKTSSGVFKLEELNLSDISISEANYNSDTDQPASTGKKDIKKSERRASQPSKLMAFLDSLRRKGKEVKKISED